MAGIVGGGTYVYLNREALAENVKEKVQPAATEAIAGALGMLDAVHPSCLKQLVLLFHHYHEYL